jgi:hypothetical protein
MAGWVIYAFLRPTSLPRVFQWNAPLRLRHHVASIGQSPSSFEVLGECMSEVLCWKPGVGKLWPANPVA